MNAGLEIIDVALAVSDRALVMRNGRIVMEGAAAEVHANRDVLESHYLGQTQETRVARPLTSVDLLALP